MVTSLEPRSATTRSSRPLPMRSATVTPTGSVPVKYPLPPLRAGPNWPLPRPGYTSTLLPPLLATIRSGGVLTAVEIGHRDRPGGQKARRRAHRNPLTPTVIDDHVVEVLARVDDVLGALPCKVGHGQCHGVSDVEQRPERAVALTCKHQDVAVLVADEQVEVAVVPEVGDGQPGWVEAGIVGDRRGEPPLAVPQVDAHRIIAQHGEVRDSVEVEVGHADDLGGFRRRDVHGVGEA